MSQDEGRSQPIITAVYADGGVVRRNPSPYGCTWAWCAVDAAGTRVSEASGLIEGNGLTNNVAEFVAAVLALESLPDGWSGELCSDSQVTLGRLCWSWTLRGIPAEWVERGGAVLRRLGELRPVLLQGHPTRADLLAGVGRKRGYPVSEHNVRCDELCSQQAAKHMANLAKVGGN